MEASSPLPTDRRAQQGAWLFLASLLVFFLSSIVMFFLYVSWRDESLMQDQAIPRSFLTSTVCLVVISVALHGAVRAIAREQWQRTMVLLVASFLLSVAFLVVQGDAMTTVVRGMGDLGPNNGVAGMVLALALLHAAHVVGGVAALAVVTARTYYRVYDHERHWGIRFTAQYWHFLDLVWLCMLAAFWYCSGGFAES